MTAYIIADALLTIGLCALTWVGGRLYQRNAARQRAHAVHRWKQHNHVELN